MQFVLEHYNYWIIILLMMGGLYIVYESQNLIKRLVGLSIFQTSVLVLYVTLGKIGGGTAPIYIDMHNGDHGGGHAEVHASADHDDASHMDAHEDDYHGAQDETTALAGHEVADAHAQDGDAHIVDDYGVTEVETAQGEAHNDVHASDAHEYGADDHHADAHHAEASDVIYSNPLPHVLMLTAIVVGVATLAVGLALVVRIREAYGTIEMDEINSADISVGEMEGETA